MRLTRRFWQTQRNAERRANGSADASPQGKSIQMTSKTQHYIDLSDIKAFRIECAKCQASLVLPLEKLGAKTIPDVCPNCQQKWGRWVHERPTWNYLHTFAAAMTSLAG